jgi:hypothetical protein
VGLEHDNEKPELSYLVPLCAGSCDDKGSWDMTWLNMRTKLSASRLSPLPNGDNDEWNPVRPGQVVLTVCFFEYIGKQARVVFDEGSQ